MNWIRISAMIAAAGISGWLWSRSQRREISSCGFLSASEFQDLNCGHYHDTNHALEVADLTERVALALGHETARAKFLHQVALLHDADQRIDPASGAVRPGTPARVQVTLDWMQNEQQRLQKQFGWSDLQFEQALALIARTDYPFDDKVRNLGTRYDGMSPIEVYRSHLQRLPKFWQSQVLADALLLRFCDQAAPYVGSFEHAVCSLKGLVQEFETNGLPVEVGQIWANTPNFLEALGAEIKIDRQLADELGQSGAWLPTREELLKALPWVARINLDNNKRRFGRECVKGWSWVSHRRRSRLMAI